MRRARGPAAEAWGVRRPVPPFRGRLFVMRPDRRNSVRLLCSSVLAVNGCQKQPAPQVATPQLSPPTMTAVAVEPARVSGPGSAAIPDTGPVAELLAPARDRMAAAALLVDSIYVSPTTLRARVAGRAIPYFGPILRILDNSVASLQGGKITGLRAGSTYLLVSAGIFSDTLPPRVLRTTRIPLTIW